MIASKSISRIWILSFEVVVCIIIGIIESNALAAQVTLAWDPNTESNLTGCRIHQGTASVPGFYLVGNKGRKGGAGSGGVSATMESTNH